MSFPSTDTIQHQNASVNYLSFQKLISLARFVRSVTFTSRIPSAPPMNFRKRGVKFNEITLNVLVKQNYPQDHGMVLVLDPTGYFAGVEFKLRMSLFKYKA